MPIFVGAMLAGRYGAGRRRCGRVELTDREKRVWKQQIEDRTYIDGVLSTYDVSHSGGLTYDELKTFLGELGERGVGLAEKIREPTDGEIKWILQTVFEGEWREADQQVTGNQICKAAMHYLSYMRHYDVLERVFDKYDTDKSGFLSKDQLTSVLTDLDEGTQPPEGVVDEVMHRASKVREEELSKPGFLQAISSWYGNLGLALKRIEAQQRKQELAAYVKATWQRYDVSKSGGLTYEELRKFLKDLHKEIASVEIEVTEAEVKWVIQMATPHVENFEGEWVSGLKQLEGESLQAAAKEWVMYLRNYDEISPVYDKHQNSAGFLDKEGLKKILVELNEGIIDDGMDEDVEAILKEASLVSDGKLSKPSFVKAISLWYSICDERQQKREAAVKETACCVVC